MRNSSDADWEEWRKERAAILLESGYDGPNVMDHVRTLEAIERLRLRCESRGIRGEAVDAPRPKQMEMPI